MKTRIIVATLGILVGFGASALAQTQHEGHVSLHTDGAEAGYHMTLPEGLTWSARVNAINVDSLAAAAAAVEAIETGEDDWTGSFALGYSRDLGEVTLSLSGMFTYGEESRTPIPGVEVRVKRNRWIGFAAWHHEDDDVAAIVSRRWRGLRVGVGIGF